MVDHPRSVVDDCWYVLKFWLDRINNFVDSAIFRFSRFGSNLPIYAHFYAVLRAYFSQMTSSIVLPQKPPPSETRCLSHKVRKSVQRYDLCAWSRKKRKDRTGQSKKSQKRYTSSSWGEALSQLICIKIYMVVVVVPDIITFAKFGTEIFRGYDFTGCRIFGFPIDSCMGLTTAQRYCAAWYSLPPF